MFDNHNKLNKNIIHYIFLFILTLNYLIPFILFGKISLFYHDTLDSEIVYNKIIGSYLFGNEDSIKLFINGEIDIDYLRRIYQPIIILYKFFNTELAYWITDVTVKVTSYISFFILSKKLNKNLFICCLVSCLFASINIPTHNGLGVAIVPYLIYLSLYKQKITTKHLLIIIFFGLNSDLVFTIFAIPFVILTLIILKDGKFNFFDKNYIKIFSIFFITILIANINLISISFSEQVFHREQFFKEPVAFADLLKFFLSSFFNLKPEINFELFLKAPNFIIISYLLIVIFFSKQKKANNIFFLIVLINLILTFLVTGYFLDYYNNIEGILRTLNFSYCSSILPFLYCLSVLLVLNNKSINLIRIGKVIILTAIILSQVNSSIVPFFKKYVYLETNYRNIYTFEEYYQNEDYQKFKKIVKDKRSISVGVDPMIAIMNNIATIDGYHNIYPLSYKKKFRKVIKKELDQNTILRKYYDNWGSRIYAFVSNPNNILIDFHEAKNLGADFVISAFELNANGLKLVCEMCSQNLKLYYIE